VSYLRRFARFWWSFVVGDNLPLAIGAGVTIGVTALLVHEGVNAWWLLPTAILALLAASVIRTSDQSRSKRMRNTRRESVRPPMARRRSAANIRTES
jgi:hypothetical protein